MSRIQAALAARALLSAGLTIREIAERLRAHPQAIKALLS